MRNKYRIEGNTLYIYVERYDVEVMADVSSLDKLMMIDATWGLSIQQSLRHTYVKCSYKGKSYIMHRYLTDAPKRLVVDHINHNTLDNRLCNLRVTTIRGNNGNRSDIVYDYVKKIKKHRNKVEVMTGETRKWTDKIKPVIAKTVWDSRRNRFENVYEYIKVAE